MGTTQRWTAAVAAASSVALVAVVVAAVAFATATPQTSPRVDETGVESPVEPLISASVSTSPAFIGPVQPEDVTAPKGTDLWTISAEGGFDLPKAAKRAYVRATKSMEAIKPACDMPWELLAGIGRVESDHGRVNDSRLGTNGVSRPKIFGVALNGVGPVAAIGDTDGGRLDRDEVWDRAVGPMQFIPSTWATWARDGDGDGRRDPHDLDDAALAAADYLCPERGHIENEPIMRAAVYSYNHSEYYVDLVIAFGLGYRTGVFDIPPPPVEPTTGAPTETADPTSPTPSQSPTKTAPVKPTNTPEPPEPTKTPKPPKPTKSPKPPKPPKLELASGTGLWTACGATYCFLGHPLDLGPSGQLAAGAAGDFDGDGQVETNRAEFTGLNGRLVTISVEKGTNIVYIVEGIGYRNADGSFSRP